LAEFRIRLIARGAETSLFETLLALLKEEKLVKPRSRQRTDSTHVLAAIHVLNRLELEEETLRHALNMLATVTPEWLRPWAPNEWLDRYTHRFEEYRLPAALAARTALAEQIGADGRRLLTAIFETPELAWLLRVPAVTTLWRVWLQQFYAGDPISWRKAEDLPPSAVVVSSPYDPDARYSQKRQTIWTGYKHPPAVGTRLTETCDEATLHIVTDVDTTSATTVDHAVTGVVQQRLAARGLTPPEHLVDTAYITADHLVTSQTTHDCTLVGPIHEHYRRGPVRGLAPPCSSSTGSTNTRRARKGRRARSGSRRRTAIITTRSRFASTTKTVGTAPSGKSASPRPASGRC
jgi:transposase